MTQIETLPQSIVKVKTVILKPRLDNSTLELLSEKIKLGLLSKFTLKPKLEDVQIISFENYYEPYLIIGGKYSLDYCRKHVFVVDVDKEVEKIYLAGQEFHSERPYSNAKNKIVKLTGEEYSHYEKETYFVLDRMKREIPPEEIPFSPFAFKRKNCKLDNSFKKITIPTEIQIDFLKSRIALRPSKLDAIIKEFFEITDRTIVYVPMYQLIFENLKNHKETAALINCITGETKVTKHEKEIGPQSSFFKSTNSQDGKTKVCPPEAAESTQNLNVVHAKKNKAKNSNAKAEISPDITLENAKESMALGFPAKISGEIFSVGDNVIAIVGDLEIYSGSKINKTLVVKGTLKIGDNCRVQGKLKVLKDVYIGADSIIEGDVIAAGDVFVGKRSLVNGFIEAVGSVQICKDANIEGGMRSNYSIPKISSNIQLMVNTENAITSAER